jgi:hypothetical protein
MPEASGRLAIRSARQIDGTRTLILRTDGERMYSTNRTLFAILREGIMTRFISLLAIAAFALSISSAEAAKKKPPVAGASATAQNAGGPQKFSYRRGDRAKGSAMAGCKMSGRC